MSNLKIYKVDSLPGTLEPSAMYLVKSGTHNLIIYLTDKLGIVTYRSPDSSDISQIALALINSLTNQPGGIAGLDLNGDLIGQVTAVIDGQNTSLMSAGDYVWDDIKAPFNDVNTSPSGNRPTFGGVMGNMRGLLFSPSTMNQVWVDFHVDHRIALGTAIYPHIHWCPTTTSTGRVRWGIEYYVARSHGQQAFSSPSTIIVEHLITSSSKWLNIVSEASDLDAIMSTDIEPDSIIKCRVYRDAGNSRDTYASNVHAWQADLHYQQARIGTRHRAPDFFTP